MSQTPPTPPVPLDYGSGRYSKDKTVPRIVWPLLALALLLLFDFFFAPGFFEVHWRNGRLFGSLIDVLNRGTPTLLLSLGMTLVIATAGVDLSVGAVMAICGAVAACLLSRPDYSPLHFINISSHIWLIVLVAVGVGLLAGVFNGALVAFIDLQPIIATLILMVAGRGIAQLLTNGQRVELTPGPMTNSFLAIGRGSWLGFPIPILIALVAFIVVAALCRFTAAGLFIESVGNNPSASRLCGVRASFVKLMAYAVAGLLAGVAGLIPTADIALADPSSIGINLELDAILAVVIGGTALTGGRFSLVGSVIGALLIQCLTTTVLTKGFTPSFTLVLKAIVVIAVCLLQAPRFRELLGFAGKSR